ncbi:hypothetical protein [Rubritalea tangerina]|uniref:hypothetical protein n=1 Tax=Rubritalea tangerina TaxID=430798 RepID=UPI0036061353
MAPEHVVYETYTFVVRHACDLILDDIFSFQVPATTLELSIDDILSRFSFGVMWLSGTVSLACFASAICSLRASNSASFSAISASFLARSLACLLRAASCSLSLVLSADLRST